MPSDTRARVRHKGPTIVEAVAACELDGDHRHRDRDAEAEHLIVERKYALSGAVETRRAEVHEHVPGQQGLDAAAKYRATSTAEHRLEAAVGGERRGTGVGEATNCDI